MQRKTERLVVHVTRAMRDDLNRKRVETGQTLGEVVRRAIALALYADKTCAKYSPAGLETR